MDGWLDQMRQLLRPRCREQDGGKPTRASNFVLGMTLVMRIILGMILVMLGAALLAKGIPLLAEELDQLLTAI